MDVDARSELDGGYDLYSRGFGESEMLFGRRGLGLVEQRDSSTIGVQLRGESEHLWPMLTAIGSCFSFLGFKNRFNSRFVNISKGEGKPNTVMIMGYVESCDMDKALRFYKGIGKERAKL